MSYVSWHEQAIIFQSQQDATQCDHEIIGVVGFGAVSPSKT